MKTYWEDMSGQDRRSARAAAAAGVRTAFKRDGTRPSSEAFAWRVEAKWPEDADEAEQVKSTGIEEMSAGLRTESNWAIT